jgi:hypothetical protein
MSIMTTPTTTTTTPSKRSTSPATPRERASVGAACKPPTVDTTPECIRDRAYQIYLTRNGTGTSGDAASDWLQAERELNRSATEPAALNGAELKARVRGEVLLSSGK